MWETNHDLAALIGSRICHDLVSPLGAIGNGLELLALEGRGDTPEMALIAQSVAQANARLRFLRVAYGRADADQRLGAGEIGSILDDLSRDARVRFDWAAGGDVSRADVQTVFLALQCFEAAMPLGGTVTVTGPEAGPGRSAPTTGWRIEGPAQPDRPDPALWEALADPARRPGEVQPAQVQFALLPAVLNETGRRAAVESTPRGLIMRF